MISISELEALIKEKKASEKDSESKVLSEIPLEELMTCLLSSDKLRVELLSLLDMSFSDEDFDIVVQDIMSKLNVQPSICYSSKPSEDECKCLDIFSYCDVESLRKSALHISAMMTSAGAKKIKGFSIGDDFIPHKNFLGTLFEISDYVKAHSNDFRGYLTNLFTEVDLPKNTVSFLSNKMTLKNRDSLNSVDYPLMYVDEDAFCVINAMSIGNNPSLIALVFLLIKQAEGYVSFDTSSVFVHY